MGKVSRCITLFKSFYIGQYAIVANTVTAGTMGLLADSILQAVEKKVAHKPWNFERTKHMTIVSTIFGPIAHFWYRFLDNRYPKKTFEHLLKKLLVDLAAAPFGYVLYVGCLCKLKNISTEDTLSEYKNKVPLLTAVDLLIWPCLQSINFLFVPPHYRIIAVMFNELIMDIVLSQLVNNDYSFSNVVQRMMKRVD